MGRKPWTTPEWKRKRAEFLVGKSCEWCGSTEPPLTINHKHNFYANFERGKLAYTLMIEYFHEGAHEKEKKEIEKSAQEKSPITYCQVCPKCGGPINKREKKKPTFRCCRCNFDFENPSSRANKDSIRKLRKAFFYEFCALYKEEIDAKFAPIQAKADEDYFSFKDVMVLCKRHNMLYTRGYHLCQVCKTRFARPEYSMCYECYIKTERGRQSQREIDDIRREDEEEDAQALDDEFFG